MEKGAEKTASSNQKEHHSVDEGMIHSGMCTPGCSCYEKTTHCEEWDPEYAPPCHCKAHNRLDWVKKVLAVERERMRKQAIHLSWSNPSWCGRYRVPYPECVLKPYEGKCSCTPGGAGGCFPEPYSVDGGVLVLQEMERIRRQRMEYLDLALMDERMPIYPYDYYGVGRGRTPMPHVDPSDILADEFAILFHAELAKRTRSGGGGGGGGGSPEPGAPPPLSISGPHPKVRKCELCGEEECSCNHAPPAYSDGPPVSQEGRRRAESTTPAYVAPPEPCAPPPLPIAHIDGEPYPDMSMAFGLLRCPECGYNEGDVCPDHNMGGPG